MEKKVSIELKIYGQHSVHSALISSKVKVKKLFATKAAYTKIRSKLTDSLVQRCQLVEEKFFSEQVKHQGIMAEITYELFHGLEEWEEYDHAKTILVLDHLHDPQNLGSIIRHAVAFDVDAIIVPKHQSCPITPTVAHTSVGCLFMMNMISVNNLPHVLKTLKDDDFGILGFDAQADVSLSSNIFWPRSAIIIGHEGSGLSPSLKKHVDQCIAIPMSPRCESLNAAVTASIVSYQRYLQLKM